MASNHETDELRAALMQCEDWGIDMASLFDLPDPPSGGAGRSRRTRPSPYPARRKRELEALRVEIAELEKSVQCVLSTRKNANALRTEWCDIATRQEQEREKATDDNDALRKIFYLQQRELLRLQKLLQRSTRIESVAQPQVSFAHYRGPELDPQLHLQKLTELEAQADEVWAAEVFINNRSTRQVRFCEAADGVQLEYEVISCLPFSVDDVASALWVETTRMANNDKTIECMHIFDNERDLVSLFISVPNQEDTTPLSEGQVATRRLPASESDGSVMLLSNYVAHFFVGGLCGGIVDGSEWIAVEPVVATSSCQLTRIKWYRRVTMGPPPSSELTPSERARWKHAITTSRRMRQQVESSVDRNIQRVENWLLTHVTAQRRKSLFGI